MTLYLKVIINSALSRHEHSMYLTLIIIHVELIKHMYMYEIIVESIKFCAI